VSEPTPVVNCATCGDELTKARHPVCGFCADARANNEVNEAIHIHEEEHDGMLTDAIRDYAERRKMLGQMSPEVFRAFEECIEELR
jgi:hypothetical protein